MSSATTQNSDVMTQIRPDDLMAELGIKKDAYYGDLKFLGIKPSKDEKGKVYLEEEQANLVRALRSYMSNNEGKREGFQVEGGALAATDAGEVVGSFHPPEQEEDPSTGFDEEALYMEAAELAGHRMTMGEQVVLALASQMTYEDLPESVRSKVDGVRSATVPKFQPEAIASNLLSKWRGQRSNQQVQAA